MKNRLGSFRLERQHENGRSHWELISPRKFPANHATVEKILAAMSDIKIRRVYQEDPINISNFSLDSPLLSLTLIDQKGEKSVLDFGLINPIDNSTYVRISSQKVIYHIDAMSFQLQGLDLTKFIDSRIFTFLPINVHTMRIYRGDKKSSQLQVAMILKNGQWTGSKGQPLDPTKVNSFMSEIITIHSLFILDKVSEELQKAVEQYTARPLYTIEVEDSNQNYYSYVVTGVINQLPGIKMERRQNFMITASNRKYPYLVEKSLIKTFYTTERSLKDLQFKKLFY